MPCNSHQSSVLDLLQGAYSALLYTQLKPMSPNFLWMRHCREVKLILPYFQILYRVTYKQCSMVTTVFSKQVMWTVLLPQKTWNWKNYLIFKDEMLRTHEWKEQNKTEWTQCNKCKKQPFIDVFQIRCS